MFPEDPIASFDKLMNDHGLKVTKYVDHTAILLEELTNLDQEAGMISGEWDGDNSGVTEDRAHAADELRDKIQDVKDLIAELEL